MTRRWLQPLWYLLAIVFLIEAWLWERLEPVVARIVAALPLRQFKAWLADRVDSLSPALTLIVFAVPVIPLFPLKLVGLWLLAHEYWISAVLLIVFAKLMGVGVTAFVFDVTKPKLLQMRWFERLYQIIIAARGKAHSLIDPIRQRAKIILRSLRSDSSARFWRIVQHLRSRAQSAR